MARFVSGPSVTSVSSPGRRRASSTIRSGAEPLGQRRRRLRQLRVADAVRAVGLRRDLERAKERRRAAGGDLDVPAARQLEHGPRVALRVLERGVARQAGDRDEVGLRAAARVEQRERVVDPGVDVEDQRNAGSGDPGGLRDAAASA